MYQALHASYLSKQIAGLELMKAFGGTESTNWFNETNQILQNAYDSFTGDIKSGDDNQYSEIETERDGYEESNEINLNDAILYDGDDITLKVSSFYNRETNQKDAYYVQFKVTNKMDKPLKFYMEKVYLEDENVNIAYLSSTNPIKVHSGKTESVSYAFSKSSTGTDYQLPNSLEELYGLNGSFYTQENDEDGSALLARTEVYNTFDLRPLR